MVIFLNKIINRVKKEFTHNSDLIIKTINVRILKTIYIVFMETLCNSNKINEFIIKPIVINKNSINKKTLNNYLSGPNTIKIDGIDTIEFYLTNGFTLIVINNIVYAVETKAELNRNISTSEVQTSLNGPKDSFTENYQTNIGLIKRRLKSNSLKIDNIYLGRKTNTIIGIVYFHDIAKEENVKTIKNRLNAIDIDGIIDSSSVAFLLDGENKTTFPTIKYSERPDEVSQELIKGKIALVVDTSPFVLIAPSFFIDFINPNIDNYNKSINVLFIKILRPIIFLLAILTPALYNALLCYNPETIPMSLLLNISIQRQGVPFPLIIEIILMLIICEILKESDLRYPSKYGSAISILGAIVLGEAAVEAGIVSPLVIIIVAITFICSLTFNDTELSQGMRYWTFIFLLSSSVLGLYGIFLAFIIFLIKICSINSLNSPYFSPLAPFNKEYFNNSFIKTSVKNNNKRSSLLTNNINCQVINNET